MSEVVKAFESVGYQFTAEEVHEFIKKRHGYVKGCVLENGANVVVTKSISDNSDDVNIKVMADLIDFAISWCAINLNYNISNPKI